MHLFIVLAVVINNFMELYIIINSFMEHYMFVETCICSLVLLPNFGLWARASCWALLQALCGSQHFAEAAELFRSPSLLLMDMLL
jgi:hypothetical protein